MATLVWVALAVALSPVLMDLFDHAATRPWARSSLIFAPLWIVAVWRERGRSTPTAWGHAALVAAVALELFAVRVDAVRLARPALPLALIGLCRAQGLASLRTAVLACWIVPLPNFLRGALSPQLETHLAALAAVPFRWAGSAVEVEAGRVALGEAGLALGSADAGLALVALLAGLGWYASLRSPGTCWRSLRAALLWGALGIPLQLLALQVALVVTSLGAPGGARTLLDHAWIAVAAAGVVWAERRVPDPPAGRAEGAGPHGAHARAR